MKNIIKVATCQFPVSFNIRKNSQYIQKQISKAKEKGAEIVHFPECALSGYIGIDHRSLEDIDWRILRQENELICKHAKQEKIWVILGSSHFIKESRLACNCLYLINNEGKLIDRYDKRLSKLADLKYYASGDHFVTFEINNVKCGLLICCEIRFPEIYREYQKLEVKCVFHSFYNARAHKKNIHTLIMRSSIQTRAASNYFWISASNACGFYQSWPSIVVRPDGKIVDSLKSHQSGIMINEFNFDRSYYDASRPFRGKVMEGIFTIGKKIDNSSNIV